MLEKIINWSEVCGLLIPLFILLVYKPSGRHAEKLKYYVLVALLLNSIAAFVVEFYFSLPAWLQNNNILYNLHSITRVFFFSWYIFSVRKNKPLVIKIIGIIYVAFILAECIFIQSPFLLNTHLFTGESILLLLLCLWFFFRSMQDETETNWLKHPAFLVCTGVLLYEAATFFIFLFFYPLFESNPEFGYLTMSIHNAMYVILCCMIAAALYKSRKKMVPA